jgi:hypothetical protein
LNYTHTHTPRSYFLVDIKSLQARYNFAKEHKVSLYYTATHVYIFNSNTLIDTYVYYVYIFMYDLANHFLR